MHNKTKKSILISISCLLSISLASCKRSFEPVVALDGDNDETIAILDNALVESFQKIYENNNYIYSFKDETDVLQIEDKATGKIWKTGIDVPRVTETYCRSLSNTAERPACYQKYPVVESGMTASTISIANSLISIEYFRVTTTSNTSFTYGSSYVGVTSTLMKVVGEDNHFKLFVDYSTCTEIDADVKIKVDLYLNDTGFDINIKDCNIYGKDSNNVKSINLTPFMGASGGLTATLNENGNGYIKSEKPITNGYVLVPDGSGAIIPFKNNSVADLSNYYSNVYGEDMAHYVSYSSRKSSVMKIKDLSMPLYGIAHTDDDMAFVAFATKGEEYMNLNVKPDNANSIQYTWAYPSFAYNFEYQQVYNQAGASFPTIAANRNHYDMNMHYSLLKNDDANYVGMAKEYKDYLTKNNLIYNRAKKEDVSIRLDFMMSDAEDSLVGKNDVVVTTANNVKNILGNVYNSLNIKNVVSSLYGWQSGGTTTQNPSKAKFSNKIGSANDFKKLYNYANDIGYDVSMYQDYYTINNDQMAYLNNAAKHINGYYAKINDYEAEYISTQAYARADRSYDFVVAQNKALSKKLNMKSMSIGGISDSLISNSTNMSRTIAKGYIEEAFRYLSEDKNLTINAVNPNLYLWKYVSRYFDCDVYDSSLLIEDETVPFIQLVLNDSMDLFAKYSNFSFYDDASILKMIDFNVYPSFVLTNESSYNLLTTNSSNYFSTEYEQYKSLIEKIYTSVNGALKNVSNATWENREVNGSLVVNTYSNGKKIAINYSNEKITYNGKDISPLGYEVM